MRRNRGNPQLTDRGYGARTARNQYNAAYYPARASKPMVVHAANYPRTAPLSAASIGSIGYPKYGTFTVGASAGNSATLDISGYSNLRAALGQAYHGGILEWHAVRNTTTNLANGGGRSVIVVNCYLSSGRGTSPYCWISGQDNWGDEARLLGVTLSAAIVTGGGGAADLELTMTNELGLGGTVLGQFWWKPFNALITV